MSGRGLLALANACEAAMGPDRGLDAALGVQAGGFHRHGSFFDVLCKDEWNYTAEGDNDTCVIPRYTASLDAAMTLVPDGDQWRVDSHYNMAGVFHYFTDGQTGPAMQEHEGEGRSPALALCAAALRARDAS